MAVRAKLGAELVKCWLVCRMRKLYKQFVGISWGGRECPTWKNHFYCRHVRAQPQLTGGGGVAKITFSDLNKGLYARIDAVIQFNTEKGKVVHPNAYALRDWIKNQI